MSFGLFLRLFFDFLTLFGIVYAHVFVDSF